MDQDLIRSLLAEIDNLEQLLSVKRKQLEEARKLEQKENLNANAAINYHSSPAAKISLFRSLFKGREDVYAKRYENKKSGKSGYTPACRNEWVQGVCEKPKITCGNCRNRAFEPVTDEVVYRHLTGFIPAKNEWQSPSPFVMGIYPLLQDETCNFLALDFDKQSWTEDAKAFLETCTLENIPSYLERSRSGNGAHVWLFFENAVHASKARKLGSYLMTRTLDRRPEIGLDSFDRFFPNQDTLPKGGFGNLIALPLQKSARDKNHSVFLGDDFSPYEDQWSLLSSVAKINEITIDNIICKASQRNELLPIQYEVTEPENEDKPWQRKTDVLPEINEPLPKIVEIVLADQIYINHSGLPPVLRNRILRLASFANPEFYRAQKMRLNTWNKPRILYCYEFFPEYIGLPVGCLDSLLLLFEPYHIKTGIKDKQNHGQYADFQFFGELRKDQKNAADNLLKHPTGILAASPAFGKTIIALWLMSQRKVNTLILVHRKQLADQWAERINQFLGIPQKEIGVYHGSKKKRTGIIDIAVMQSMVKKEKIEEWVNEYGQIIVDECHHISAESFERIIRKCPAYYRLGLSASVIRKDGQHPIVLMNLGDVRFHDVHKNNPIPYEQNVLLRRTMFTIHGEMEKIPIQDVFHTLWQDINRNTLILDDIQQAYSEGREILVLSDRIEHLDLLEKDLKGKVPCLFVLNGGLGKKRLKEIMDGIQSVSENESRIILSTGKYLGEGFDLPCLDTLFLVFPFSWKGTLIQYTGRLNRMYYGKREIRVYDYVDEKVPVLKRMFERRLKGYKSLGFHIKNDVF